MNASKPRLVSFAPFTVGLHHEALEPHSCLGLVGLGQFGRVGCLFDGFNFFDLAMGFLRLHGLLLDNEQLLLLLPKSSFPTYIVQDLRLLLLHQHTVP